jgi:predicted O-methyltransferase YrrM
MIKQVLQLQWKAWTIAIRTIIFPVTSLIRRKDRHLIWRLWEVCFGSQRPGVYPEVQLTKLMDSSTSVQLHDLPAEPYNVTITELLALAAITSQLDARTVFEFGTADGRTTLNLAANINLSGQVYTINLPLEQDSKHTQEVPVGFRFKERPEANRIKQLWGDTKTFDFSPYFNSCQVVFIDADHSHEAVWRDSQTALKLVDHRLGIIIWHDALAYSVQTALPRLMSQSNLPIHLIAGTNLAVLLFASGKTMMPDEWIRQIHQPYHSQEILTKTEK